jgi:2-oxoglutarate ferredoxin oxidoreductase subunit alpha
MNMGQMLLDVNLAVGPDYPVDFFGTAGGIIPSPDEVRREILKSLARAENGEKAHAKDL